jgi:hypothetical protein
MRSGGDGKHEGWTDGREEADTHNVGPMQSPLREFVLKLNSYTELWGSIGEFIVET